MGKWREQSGRRDPELEEAAKQIAGSRVEQTPVVRIDGLKALLHASAGLAPEARAAHIRQGFYHMHGVQRETRKREKLHTKIFDNEAQILGDELKLGALNHKALHVVMETGELLGAFDGGKAPEAYKGKHKEDVVVDILKGIDNPDNRYLAIMILGLADTDKIQKTLHQPQELLSYLELCPNEKDKLETLEEYFWGTKLETTLEETELLRTASKSIGMVANVLAANGGNGASR